MDVPETRLRVEGGRVGVGGEWEVSEGDSLIFLCDVHADPPAYNITWLLNGRVVGVGGRRWMRDNASLVVSPVERSDAGLYTCLASNREGDGHSNAILVRVTHAPYCAGPSEQSLVVASNTSVTLTCRVEAVPRDLKFTWKMGSPVAVLKGKGEPPPPRHSGDLPSTSLSSPPVGGGPSSMHAHTPRPQMPLGTYPPRLEQVQVSKNVVRVAASVQVAAASPSAVAASPSEAASLSEAAPPTEAAWRKLGKDSWEVRGSMEDGEEREVEGRVDGGHPDRSSLTLTPAASILVGCYARNSVGHIRIPCTYSITVLCQQTVHLAVQQTVHQLCQQTVHPAVSADCSPSVSADCSTSCVNRLFTQLCQQTVHLAVSADCSPSSVSRLFNQLCQQTVHPAVSADCSPSCVSRLFTSMSADCSPAVSQTVPSSVSRLFNQLCQQTVHLAVSADCSPSYVSRLFT
nr:neural cell adhesion molecule 1-like [Cherax quadricarinatus]